MFTQKNNLFEKCYYLFPVILVANDLINIPTPPVYGLSH